MITRIIKAIYRLYIEKSDSDTKIKYFKKKGMKIGKNCHIDTMAFSPEPYLIEIGDHVAIAVGTQFVTHDGGTFCFQDEIPDCDIFGRIIIGNNVHIGTNCTILPNTTIGNNCIIGACSVVRGKFPDNSVIIGNPATVVTNMSVQKFLYKNNPGRLKTARMTDPEKEPIVKKHFNIQ